MSSIQQSNNYNLSLVPRLQPFLRSDDRERVWSIEQTFLFQLWNVVAGVGMKIRPHVLAYLAVVHQQAQNNLT